MSNSPFNPKDVLEFFEQTVGVRFVDIETKRPALEVIAEKEKVEQKSDYDLWLEQQDEEIQAEHRMAEL